MLQRNNLEDDVYEAVLERLLRGCYAPGDRIDINLLKEELGVSSTPVLNALKRLVFGGLLETTPRNMGYYMPQYTLQDMEEVCSSIHFMTLAACTKICSMKNADEIADRLQILADKTLVVSKLRDHIEYMRVDQEFHGEILGWLGNKRLLTIYRDLGNQYNCMLQIFLPEQLHSMSICTPENHQVYIDAIRSRDMSLLYRMSSQELQNFKNELNE